LTPAALRRRVLAYLRAHHVVNLATHGAAGPWAAAVFYANDGFALYWLSAPSSRHSVNLARAPRIAATVNADTADWRRVKGVQLEGVAQELSGDAARRAQALYGRKYPLVGRLATAPPAIAAAMARVRWYRLVPERLYFVDNAVAFGHRCEIGLAPARKRSAPRRVRQFKT
jgi:uncharacterized protein YhbP (UPF0306 family)